LKGLSLVSAKVLSARQLQLLVAELGLGTQCAKGEERHNDDAQQNADDVVPTDAEVLGGVLAAVRPELDRLALVGGKGTLKLCERECV
jgi:hypothetical protein